MNIPLLLLLAWFAPGAALAIFGWWYMKTHEQEMVDKDPEFQIFGCIPPPIKWGVVVVMVLFGPFVLLRGICDAIQESRKEKDENDASGTTPVAAPPPEIDPRVGCMVLYGLMGAALTAWIWAVPHPEKPLSMFLKYQAQTMGFWLVAFVVPGLLVDWRKPFRSLQLPALLLPLYLVAEVIPAVVAMTAEWEGGWALGIAGAFTGGAAGAAMGRLFHRWMVAENERQYPSPRQRAVVLPILFAVFFAIYGASSWASVYLTPDYAWVIGIFPLFFLFLGGLVGRPLLGMLTTLPLVLLQLIPLVALLTVGWEGGLALGVAGAAAGAVAGAVNGWLYDRWIMPEYDKLRAAKSAIRPPGSTDGPGSSGSMAEHS
jgi:hypothetical protein